MSYNEEPFDVRIEFKVIFANIKMEMYYKNHFLCEK